MQNLHHLPEAQYIAIVPPTRCRHFYVLACFIKGEPSCFFFGDTIDSFDALSRKHPEFLTACWLAQASGETLSMNAVALKSTRTSRRGDKFACGLVRCAAWIGDGHLFVKTGPRVLNVPSHLIYSELEATIDILEADLDDLFKGESEGSCKDHPLPTVENIWFNDFYMRKWQLGEERINQLIQQQRSNHA